METGRASTRHSTITGDFAEALVLYWLSKQGYECARVDLIASKPDGSLRMGISVQGRSRPVGLETSSVNLHPPQSAIAACKSFKLEPYSAIVVDAGAVIRGYLFKFECLSGIKYFQMTERAQKRYKSNKEIRYFELSATNWPLISRRVPTKKAAVNKVVQGQSHRRR